jgi:hypothetical protein
MRWLIFCIVGAFFLAGCTPELQAGKIDEPVREPVILEPTNPCDRITCSQNEQCQAGVCICTGKKCEDRCLTTGACCSTADCQDGEICRNNRCAKVETCGFSEAYDDEYTVCACSPGKVFCGPQNKCIDAGKCCSHADCPSFNRCKPTLFRTSICVKFEEKKLCRTVADDGRDILFDLGEREGRIKLEKIFEDSSLIIRVGKENITLTPNSTAPFLDGILWSEGVDVIGGQCEEDKD